jgi:ABC-type phosphate transport system substrate-binding protein
MVGRVGNAPFWMGNGGFAFLQVAMVKGMKMGSVRRRLRRRRIARVTVPLAVLGVLAMFTLPGASAAVAQSTAATPTPPASASPTPAPTPPPAPSQTKCVTASSGATTCTGTYGGDTAWEPTNTIGGGSENPNPPSVTVSQTHDLVDQSVSVSWQNFTPGKTNEGGTPPVGVDPAVYNIGLYECRGTNPRAPSVGQTDTVSPDCYAGASAYGYTALPNTQILFTASDGTGQGTFHIEAGTEDNNFLNCDVNTPCSLVVVPNWGGEEPLGSAFKEDCANHAQDFFRLGHQFSAANNYIGQPCSWNDRFVVPLSFAQTPANCPPKTPEFYAQGSPMMTRAMTQWQSKWCNSSAPVSLNYTSIDEPDARTDFLQGGQNLGASIDMAVVTLPDAGQASSRKFTYAPLANSGVAMAYYLDDAQTKQPINQVVLDPRLVAKLTTESYSLQYDCTQEPLPLNSGTGPQWPQLPGPSDTCDPAVTHNPHTLFDDQEFLSLNKDCQPAGEAKNYVCGASDFPGDGSDGNQMLLGPFLPTVLGGNSDMTFQLTDWVHANADAAAFLAGQVDPWDMHVNSNYLNISYPTWYFQTLDPGTTYPDQGAIKCTGLSCSGTGLWDATMNAAWNPVTPLDSIANNLLALQPSAKQPFVNCTLPGNAGCTNAAQLGLIAASAESPGNRDLFSELDLGDVAAYQFPATAMVNAAGTAVQPTQASVEAAVKDMKTNPDGITQYANESSTDKAAYPLAMVDYAMVPTCGLPSSEASAIADFLTKVATTGQTQGYAPGDLAPGYYPLNSKQRAQTLAAAKAVKSQDCKSAPRDTTVSGLPVNDLNPPKAGGAAPNGAGTPSGPGSGKPGLGKPGSGTNGARTPAGSTTPGARTMAYGEKSPDSGLAGVLLVLAMVLGGLLLVGGPAAWAITATGKWPVVLRWLRPVQARLRAALAWFTGLTVRRA